MASSAPRGVIVGSNRAEAGPCGPPACSPAMCAASPMSVPSGVESARRHEGIAQRLPLASANRTRTELGALIGFGWVGEAFRVAGDGSTTRAWARSARRREGGRPFSMTRRILTSESRLRTGLREHSAGSPPPRTWRPDATPRVAVEVEEAAKDLPPRARGHRGEGGSRSGGWVAVRDRRRPRGTLEVVARCLLPLIRHSSGFRPAEDPDPLHRLPPEVLHVLETGFVRRRYSARVADRGERPPRKATSAAKSWCRCVTARAWPPTCICR